MTNASDFRRYSYGIDFETRNAVSAFSQTRSSAAPKYTPDVMPEAPVPRRKRKLSVTTNERLKSREELIASQRLARKQMLVIVSVISLAAVMLFGMLFTYAVKNEYTRQIASLKTELSREVNQNICTNAELEALVTIEQIEDYAVNKLGMVKLQSDQVRYIDVEQYKAERNAALNEQPLDEAAADTAVPEAN
ncbi:MAG: hypothetical protein K2J55_03940 [Eubacterium sp.]|nr:hypothetical protein [Eubacterium sp.]